MVDNNLTHLHDMCSSYTVLYVEDDAQTQESMNTVLSRIFKKVYLAENGLIGLELFQTHSPDLIITDIQMPKLNGLDMAKSIKEIAPQTPIIITTAFNEEHYFLSAIENGIDSFLFKPIDKQKLFQALIKTVSQIAYKAQTKELERIQKIQEINQASEESIQNLSNLFPFPTLFYKENTLIFVNTEAHKTFEKIALESIVQETAFVSQFNITKDKRQKIKLPTTSGLNRIYWVYPNSLFVGVDFTLVQAYIFIDITVMEYQKLRLSAYSLPILKKNLDQTSSHIPKITAKEFIKSLDANTLQSLHEIEELQDFIVNFAYDYQVNPHDGICAKISEIYLCYARKMEKLEEFKTLGAILQNTISLLFKIHLDKRQCQKLSLFFLALSEELFQWFTTIFISKNALDIHYLDDVIMTSCLQVELEFAHEKNNLPGDDLELS